MGGEIPVFPQPPKSPSFYLAGPEKAPVVIALLQSAVHPRFACAWCEALLAGFDSMRGGNACPADVFLLDRLYRAEFRVPHGQQPPLEPHLCGLEYEVVGWRVTKF